MRYTASQEMFIRLLQVLDLKTPLDQSDAQELANAVIDWIDSDSNIRSPGGAEDGYYADLELPYYAGNKLLHSVSELRWVKGMTPEIYRALEPYVSVLDQSARLNINTADKILVSAINVKGLLDPLSADAEDIVNDRDGDITADITQQKSGFESVSEFASNHPVPNVDITMLSVKSEYFLLKTEAIFLDRKFKLYSIMRRDSDGIIKTIARGPSGFGDCESAL
jgi:general secretion pathway protein K